MRLTGGRRSNWKKKSRMSSDPSTNSGSALNDSDVTEMPWSSGRPARIAASTPNRSASGIVKIVVAAASTNELPSFPLTLSQIGSSPPWA
jgi:hypothetical protein